MITALANQMKSCEYKPTHYLLIALTTNTPVQASTKSVQFTRAQFYGYSAVSKTAAPTANSADAQIGYADPDASVVSPAKQPVFVDVVTKGLSVIKGAEGVGVKYDLADVWFLGTTNDKILIAYEQ